MPGFILYRGPSQLDGTPIVVVAITATTNAKTGDMLQTYILPDGPLSPLDAAKIGADASVCGDCKLRPAHGGACYVTLIHGPGSVWRALQRGAYPAAVPYANAFFAKKENGARALGMGRMVRIGAYGDPAAAPLAVWERITAFADGRTGYTHQWRSPATQNLRPLVMASVDTPEEREEARRMGWRTFRVRLAAEPVLPGEFVCPASHEAGKRKTCAECGACDGHREGDRAASPVIIAHGSKASRYIMMRAA